MSAPSRPAPSAIGLRYDAFGRLVLTTAEGAEHVGVVPVRCFPFSAPSGAISFCDEAGHEVCCLGSLDELPPKTRSFLEADLARRELVPVIRRINRVSSGPEPTFWHVETDRGETSFQLPGEDHVRRMGEGALITDSHGLHFRIVRIRALDARSRKFLERYL
ncbi:MAG: DUF1854 domain-containing protein [Myxococcales bacterium]|jgi:hypothetical protein